LRKNGLYCGAAKQNYLEMCSKQTKRLYWLDFSVGMMNLARGFGRYTILSKYRVVFLLGDFSFSLKEKVQKERNTQL